MRKNKFPTSFPFFDTLRIMLSKKLLILFSDIFDENEKRGSDYSGSIVSHIVQLALVCETHDPRGSSKQ